MFNGKNPLFLWPFSSSLFVCLPGRVNVDQVGSVPPNFQGRHRGLKLSGGPEQRIIIVGGGPSGMHMSACLAAKGYTKAGTKNPNKNPGGLMSSWLMIWIRKHEDSISSYKFMVDDMIPCWYVFMETFRYHTDLDKNRWLARTLAFGSKGFKWF